jgi:hypothetical protein
MSEPKPKCEDCAALLERMKPYLKSFMAEEVESYLRTYHESGHRNPPVYKTERT